jgi:hypothetical protein
MKRKFLILAVACAMLLTPLAASAGETAAARGFDTPEACARAVFAALVAQDADGLEACFAFHELAERFDFVKFGDRLSAIMTYNTLLPPTCAFNIAYNESELRRRLYIRLCYTALLINDPESADLISGQTIAKGSDAYDQALAAFTGDAMPTGYSHFRLTDVIDAADVPEYGELYASERNQTNMVVQMAPEGVDGYTELAILMKWDEADSLFGAATYIMPLRLVKIGDRWLADPNVPNLASLMGFNTYTLLAALQ